MASRPNPSTSENRGPLINIASWTTLVSMLIVVGFKLLSKLVLVRKLQLDDYLIILTTLIACGQVSATSIEIKAGLGRVKSSPEHVQELEKAELASEMLYVTALFFCRATIHRFYDVLALSSHVLWTIRGLTIVDFAWLISSLFSLAFQCRPPGTWSLDQASCFNQPAFWTAYGVITVVMDSITALLPIYLLRDLKIASKKRNTVLTTFLMRLLILPLPILRIIYAWQAYGAESWTFGAYYMVLVTEIHINISIIATAVPFLKPLIDDMQSGILNPDLRLVLASKLRRQSQPQVVEHVVGTIHDFAGFQATHGSTAGADFNAWPSPIFQTRTYSSASKHPVVTDADVVIDEQAATPDTDRARYSI